MLETGLEMKQLTNWFVNNRKRYWKPRVEARLQDQGRPSPLSDPPIIKRHVSLLSFDDGSSSGSVLSNVALRTSKRRSAAPRSLRGKRAVLVSPACIVSEQSSVASVSDGVTSSDDDEDAAVQTIGNRTVSHEEFIKEERVDVHILRPTSGLHPELSDVTILNSPSQCVLHTYEDCAFTYRYTNEEEAPSCRDAEIVGMKKHYLSLFRAEAASTDYAAAVVGTLPTALTKKRKELVDVVPVTPRPKYRRVSVELWKEACQTADHVYDHALPSLEEATQLFGYAM